LAAGIAHHLWKESVGLFWPPVNQRGVVGPILHPVALEYWFIGSLWPGRWSTARFYRMKLVVSDGKLTTDLASLLRSVPGTKSWCRDYGKVKWVRVVGASGILVKRTIVEVEGEAMRSRFALPRDDAERFVTLFPPPLGSN
jgi:hypothetical protein